MNNLSKNGAMMSVINAEAPRSAFPNGHERITRMLPDHLVEMKGQSGILLKLAKSLASAVSADSQVINKNGDPPCLPRPYSLYKPRQNQKS